MAISGAGTVFLVDGSGFIFRAFHALPYLSNQRGLPTNALYGYLQMLLKLTKEYRPDYLAVAFDDSKRTFRDEVFPEYKANRKAPPEDLIPQFPYFRQLVEAFNIPALGVPGFEADDVIATLTRRARAQGLRVVIVSSDKDLMQLIEDDGSVVMLDTLKDKVFGSAEVVEKFGVPPTKVLEVLALMGDSSDNVPGVTGIGPKTAAELITRFGDVEGVLSHAAELTGKKRETLLAEADAARLSRKLVALAEDAPVPEIETLRRASPDLGKLEPLLRELDFTKHLKELAPRVELDRKRYRLVATPAALEALVAELAAAPSLAVDVLSDGPGPLLSIGPGGPGHPGVVGLALAAPGVAAAYVPLGHQRGAPADLFSPAAAPTQPGAADVARLLGPLLADARRPKIAHDIKRLSQAAAALGVTLAGPRLDPMIASYLCDASRTSHELPDLALGLLQHAMLPREQVTGKGKAELPLSAATPEAAMPHAAERADAALALGLRLAEEIARDPDLARLERDVELPLAEVLARIELHGIRLDIGVLEGLGAAMDKEIIELQTVLDAAAGHPLNVGSPKQLQDFLFNTLGLEPDKKRKIKTGFSTDASTLQSLAPDNPVVGKILEHRALTKLKSTYIEILPRLVDRASGRVHTVFNQAVAATGRLSSESPNLQNIPIRTELGRSIRRAFVADPGNLLVSADYSQIELRVVAHLASDAALIAAFNDARGIDVHTRTAAEVFQVAEAAVTSQQRRIAKAVNYAVMYGQSDFGLAQVIGVERAEARRYIERYFETFSGVRDYMQRVIAEARDSGVSTTLLGRRRPLPDLRSPNFQARSAAERMARNTPIQGSAADILKLAMIAMQRRLDAEAGAGSNGPLAGARMLLTVHDELVFEVPAARADALVAAAREEMSGVVKLAVPLAVDAAKGPTWADVH